jgi:hypothetical protein
MIFQHRQLRDEDIQVCITRMRNERDRMIAYLSGEFDLGWMSADALERLLRVKLDEPDERTETLGWYA